METIVEFVQKTCHTGVKLSQKAMAVLEKRFERLPGLEKYFVTISPLPNSVLGWLFFRNCLREPVQTFFAGKYSGRRIGRKSNLRGFENLGGFVWLFLSLELRQDVNFAAVQIVASRDNLQAARVYQLGQNRIGRF